MQEILLKARKVCRTYTEGAVKTAVLNDINIDIYADEITAIIGKSGSGKSTLLHILGTLDSQSDGEIIFDNINLKNLTSSQKANFRNQSLGFVYQFHHLLGDFTALENVMMPLVIAKTPMEKAQSRAREYLIKVGLEHRLNYKPSEMSGGERQRVAIARAMVNHPKLILADEPTGNLDANNAKAIFDLFLNLAHTEHTAVVMVTHDESLAQKCDRIYTIEDGRINV